MAPTRRHLLRASIALPLSALPFTAHAAGGEPDELSLYTSMPTRDVEAVIEAFGAATGIRVKAWRSGSEQVAQRVIAETRAGRQAFDVVETNAQSLEPMRAAAAFQPLAPLLGEALRAGVTPAHGAWTGTRMSVFCCAWNTGLVREEEVPGSYEDLAQPRWARRIAFESDNHAWFAAMHGALGELRAARLFDAIAAQGILVRKGHSLIANLLAAGEIPLSLHVYSYRASQLERTGTPVRHRLLAPTLANSAAVAVAAGTRRAAAAVRFARFLQDEGQALLAGRMHVPALASAGVPPFPGPLVPVEAGYGSGDPARVWRQRYQEFLRKGTAAR